MSNIKTFNKKSRKGISPVIATVILVAVAVVIAAALAGFSSSLFGTYSSQGSAINVAKLELSEGGDGILKLVNNGNTKDTISTVSVPPNAAMDVGTDVTPHADSGDVALTLDGTFTEGDTVTVKINMASGLQLSQSVIVGPAA